MHGAARPQQACHAGPPLRRFRDGVVETGLPNLPYDQEALQGRQRTLLHQPSHLHDKRGHVLPALPRRQGMHVGQGAHARAAPQQRQGQSVPPRCRALRRWAAAFASRSARDPGETMPGT